MFIHDVNIGAMFIHDVNIDAVFIFKVKFFKGEAWVGGPPLGSNEL